MCSPKSIYLGNWKSLLTLLTWPEHGAAGSMLPSGGNFRVNSHTIPCSCIYSLVPIFCLGRTVMKYCHGIQSWKLTLLQLRLYLEDIISRISINNSIFILLSCPNTCVIVVFIPCEMVHLVLAHQTPDYTSVYGWL